MRRLRERYEFSPLTIGANGKVVRVILLGAWGWLDHNWDVIPNLIKKLSCLIWE